MAQKKLFCSLDLEGTGLDPAKDHITEVGAVLFDVAPDGSITFHEEFSQLVKPPIPIPKFIQDLTSIRDEDVADAPEWKEVLPKFEKFVGKHPIIGQNIMFDLKFLEAHGLSFSQQTIDTQELARIFVPNARFYNMEYLFRYFGLAIESHHRALTDAKSAAILLQEIIKSFHRLPDDTRVEVARLMKKGGLAYREFFSDPKNRLKKNTDSRPPVANGEQQALFTPKVSKSSLLSQKEMKELSGMQGETLVRLPIAAQNHAGCVQLAKINSTSALIVPDPAQARRLASDLGRPLLPEPGEILCLPRLQRLLERSEIPDSLAVLLAKVLVWKASREEDQVLQFLPLAGSEYILKRLFSCDWEQCSRHTGEDRKKCAFYQLWFVVKKSESFVASHSAWLSLIRNDPQFSRRQLLIWEAEKFISELEQSAVRTFTVRWLKALVELLSDSEKGEGMLYHNEIFRKLAEEFLNQLDLDFGLLAIELNSELQLESKFSVDEEVRDSVWFRKMREVYVRLVDRLQSLIKRAAELSAGDAGATQILSSLEEQSVFLKEFFSKPSSNSVYWVDGYRSELKLKNRSTGLPAWRPQDLTSMKLLDLWSDRSIIEYAVNTLRLKQPEEFSFSEDKQKIQLYLPDEHAGVEQDSLSEQLGSILRSASGRTLVVFNSQKNLEITYESSRETLNEHLLAQRITGHHWKNAERYQEDPRSIWFITAHNFLKQINELPPTRTLVITRIPYEASDSGFFTREAPDAFTSHVIPKTAIRMEQFILRLIQSGEKKEIKNVIIIDKRISKDYNEPLVSAIESHCEVSRHVLDSGEIIEEAEEQS